MTNKSGFEHQMSAAINGDVDIFKFLNDLKAFQSKEDIEFVEHIVSETLSRLVKESPVDWGKVQYLILIASRFPSEKYVESLCDILRELSVDMTNEDVVDLLQVIKSERATPTLIKLLDVELDGDHFYELNKKALLALDSIGSKEAVKAIYQATNSNYLEVKTLAEHLVAS